GDRSVTSFEALTKSSRAILDISHLRVAVRSKRASFDVLRGIDLRIEDGAILGIVGESGSGKSVLARSITHLLPDTMRTAGSIVFNGVELVGAGGDVLREVRGNGVGMIFQDPRRALNPVLTVGDQVIEAVRVNSRMRRTEARRRAHQLLEMVLF